MTARPTEGTLVATPWLLPAQGFVTIPGHASNALSADAAAHSIYVTGSGNLVVQLANGTSNAGSPIAATPSQVPIPMMVVKTLASNTAAIIGVT